MAFLSGASLWKEKTDRNLVVESHSAAFESAGTPFAVRCPGTRVRVWKMQEWAGTTQCWHKVNAEFKSTCLDQPK